MRGEPGLALVRPHAGLCNRLGVLASSAMLAREMGLPLRLHWVPGDGCWCRFEDLFETGSAFELTRVREPLLPARPAKELDWLARRLPARLHAAWLARRHRVPPPWGIITRAYVEAAGGVVDPADFRRFRSLIVFRNVLAFRVAGWPRQRQEAAVSDFLQALVPVAAVRSRLFELPEGTIGVHGRRTDHARSRAVSTSGKFLQAIEKALAEHPGARLFVASDDPSFIEEIRARHPDRVLDRGPMERSRHDRTGVQEALADLLMLSRCTLILGSALSTFSEYAAAFRRVPLIRVGVEPATSAT